MSDEMKYMIKEFNGQGDVSTWIKKVKLVATTKKITDLASVLPLYLDGPAFAVFDQMKEEKKKDAQEIERVLLDAFGMNAFQAYDNFRQRTLMCGEPVDVYLSEL